MTPSKILIIDHDPGRCGRLSEELKAQGWAVLESSGGPEAVRLAQRNSPDVILLELALPAGATEPIARQLKFDPLTCAIPIVVLEPPGRRAPLKSWADASASPTATLPVLLAQLQSVLAKKKGSKPHVLVVDDEPDLVEILTALLNARGFAASGAHDGAQALEVVHTVRPDAVLLDLEMPNVGGWEFLHRLKLDRTLQHVRVIILTGKDRSPEDRQQGLALGASAYLLKPCAPEEIIEALQAALRPPGRGR